MKGYLRRERWNRLHITDTPMTAAAIAVKQILDEVVHHVGFVLDALKQEDGQRKAP
ncbi:MAG: hypothetical protein MZU97_14640 [Bacillus subtilis]|nr:hypothetical protein [Bacillus subtilis]